MNKPMIVNTDVTFINNNGGISKNDPVNLNFIESFYLMNQTYSGRSVIEFQMVSGKTRSWFFQTEAERGHTLNILNKMVNLTIINQE